jgi:adenylylsulfate kinase
LASIHRATGFGLSGSLHVTFSPAPGVLVCGVNSNQTQLLRNRRDTGWTVWFTGLSGSGKSTLARALASRLDALSIGYEILDGDEIRRDLSPDLGFSASDRDENIRRIGFLARLLNRHEVVSIVAAISPYHEMREAVRRRSARFLQVHVDCSLDTLIERDTKGFYRRAMAGEIPQFSGISDVYETPTNPDVYFDTGKLIPEDCVDLIVLKLQELKWLPGSPEKSGSPRLRAAEEPAGRAAAGALKYLSAFGNRLYGQILFAFALVGLALAADWTAQSIWGSSSPLILAGGVALSTFVLGLRAGLVSVAAATLLADYFYIAPVFTWTLDHHTFWMSAQFLAIAIATHYAVRLLKFREIEQTAR